MLAAQSGHFEILDALLTKGAKADTQNEVIDCFFCVFLYLITSTVSHPIFQDGNSALMLAAKGGHLEVVTALLEVYANRDMVNKVNNK